MAATMTTKDLNKTVKDVHAIEKAVDALIIKMVRGEPVHPEQYILFQKNGWNTHQVKRAVDRKRGDIELLRKCGTAADREQAAADVAKLKADKKAENAELRTKLATLQAKLDANEKAVADAEQNHRDMMRSYELAKDRVCPNWVKLQRSSEVQAIKASAEGKHVRELEGQVRLYSSLLRLDHPDLIRNYCEQHCQKALRVEQIGLNGRTVKVDMDTFYAHRKEQIKQLPELEDQLLKARSRYENLIAEADAILDHYMEELMERFNEE